MYVFFVISLSYVSSSICKVSEGELCNKLWNMIFSQCSVTNIFKCNDPTICMNKQTADNWCHKCLWWQNLLWSDVMKTTNSWLWNILCSIIHLKKCQILGTLWDYDMYSPESIHVLTDSCACSCVSYHMVLWIFSYVPCQFLCMFLLLLTHIVLDLHTCS
jgi:hypothetical protein